ncbi:MAG: nicotinate (nicotinamide) nucleotide adenylyltransferase [Clostridiales bacterium]|nr:nicotinate (nicotinamide) nucleotide adenylyltransferase [Clostridiales bacterium]
MKIAIFGGAFNPVHNEHINLVQSAIKTAGIDKVFIMPSHISPHKTGKIFADATHRIKSCELAFKNIPQAQVSDFEILQGGVSYSYLTCEHFKKQYPNDELYFIIGADMLEYFPHWKNPERILNCVTLLSCAREDDKSFALAVQNFNKKYPNNKVATFDYIGDKVSSTAVRTLSALGEDILPFVPKQVKNYLDEHQIYTQNKLIKVRELLTEERWQHTVRVCLMAVKNCGLAGVDELTALTAAALHDCAKYPEKCGDLLAGFKCPQGVPNPVVHQFAGAYMAVNYFKITNPAVISAIKYHTSGRKNMSPLEKLIFLSDMLEEGRSFDGVNELRTLFYKDLTLCLKAALSHQIKYLHSTGKPVYNLTQKAYDFLKGENNE